MIIKKNTLFLFFTCILVTKLVVAQQNNHVLEGKATNHYLLDLEDVTIQLVELNLFTTTGKKGNFSFKNIPFGTYTLLVNSNQYKNVSTKIHFNKNSTTQKLVLEEVETLEEVNIIAVKKQALKEMGYEVNVIDFKDEVKSTKTLNDVINQVSSVHVKQSGGLGSRVNYAINGLSDNSVRFFIDGIPMEYYGSTYSLNTLPTSIVNKIEIYKGVTPIYLSNDNLGGAINLVTKKKRENTVDISYKLGSFNTHVTSVNTYLQNKSKELYFSGFGFYNYSDNNYKVWGDKILLTDPETFEVSRNHKVERFHDAFESKGIKTSVGLKNKSWANKLETGFIYADLDKEIQHGTTMEKPFGEANYSQKLYTTYLDYAHNNLLNNKLGVSIYAGYNNLTRVFTDISKNIYDWNGDIIGQRTIGGELFERLTLNTLKQNTYLQKTAINYNLIKNHKAHFAWQSAFINRNENDPTIANPNEAYYSPQHFDKNSLGFSLDSKWLKKALKTSVFVKNHFYNATIKTTEDGQTFTSTKTGSNLIGYGFSAKYKITPLLGIKTSFEKANRLPEEEEVLGNGVNILSTADLAPEQSYNYNIGLEQKFFLNEESTLGYELTFYKRDVTNLIKLWSDGDSVFKYINFDKIDITGFDTTLNYQWKNIVQVNYSLSKLNPVIENKYDSDGNLNLLYKSTLANTLLLKSTLNTQIRFKNTFQKQDEITLNITSLFGDTFYVLDDYFGNSDKDNIPQQLSHNIGINYIFPNKNIALALGCNNIFNEQLFDNFAIQKPGRAFYFKINWSII